jgi:hypothetical protein
MNKNLEFEYDLQQSIDWQDTKFEDEDAEVDWEWTTKNLSNRGYQKIVWHDAKKELPECDKYVLGHYVSDNTYAVVKWDCADWSDDNKVCYNVDYWTELPEFTHTDKIYETEMAKNTAKNILNSLLDKLHEVTGCGTPYQVKKIIKEVAKEYDIELDTAKYD